GPFRDGRCYVSMKRRVSSPERNLQGLPRLPSLGQVEKEMWREAASCRSERAQRAQAKLHASLEAIGIGFHDGKFGPRACSGTGIIGRVFCACADNGKTNGSDVSIKLNRSSFFH